MSKPTRTFTVADKYGPRSVQTPLTDAEALEALGRIEMDFARSLCDQAKYRPLSEKQMAWVHILAWEATENDRIQREGVEALVQDERDMDGIVRMLCGAGERLQSPMIVLTHEGRQYRLGVMDAKSGHEGSVLVRDNRSGLWLGRISTDGLWFPLRSLAQYPGLVDLLVRFAQDPADVAREQGRLTGYCCFCCRQLTDPVSVEMGWGPICARSYKLPWVKVARKSGAAKATA